MYKSEFEHAGGGRQRMPRQCDCCMFRLGGSHCVAFPRGIPAEILAGRFDHTQPYPGDGDIRFLQRSVAAYAAGTNGWDEV
jgi:hypothetical protein